MVELPFLAQLTSQGLLGVLLALSLSINWYFVRKLQEVNEKRVQDAQEITSKLLDPINAIKVNSELVITLFNRFLGNNNHT
mgnify:CR=1 FL=1